MKIAWVHSFDLSENENAGIFMFQLMKSLRKKGVFIDDFYTGHINPLTIRKIIKRLKENIKGYDLIHAQYGSGCSFVTSAIPGSKLLTLRGSDWYVGKNSDNLKTYLHSRASVFLSKLSLKKFNRVITMSDEMAASVRQYVSGGTRVDTIVDGIDLKKFQLSDPLLSRKCFDKYDETFWVLFSSVTKGNPIKRYELAEKAFLEAKKRIPELTLKYMNGISHNDTPNFINACNIILLTSTHEGWPNIIKEGLALNKPFVSTNVSDLKSIAINENSCTIVEEGNELEMIFNLANGIIKAFHYLKSNKPYLRKYVIEMDIEKIADRLILLYQQELQK